MKNKREKGTGMIRKRKDGRWEGRIVIGYDEKGLPTTKNVVAKQKNKCIDKLKELEKEIGIVKHTNINSNVTFGEWLDFCYQNYTKISLKKTTQLNYENSIYNHIIQDIGKIILKELTTNDLQQYYAKLKINGRKQYVDKLGKGLSNRVIRSIHGICRTALEKAMIDGLIRDNPAKDCKLPPKKKREMQVLTKEEMQRFLIQAKYDGFLEIMLLALTTGMRKGEIMGMQWNDLNISTGEVNIKRQVSYTPKGLLISQPKTQSSIRTIILPKTVLNILVEYKKQATTEWIFQSPVKEDMPRNPVTIYKVMQKILKKANCKRIRFHDLRHTFATTALANGIDIKTLSTILGHISTKTTLDIYTHSTTEMQKNAATKIDKIMGSKNRPINEENSTNTHNTEQIKFEPVKAKIRKAGTGCISKINDNLYEGRYSPRLANGKRLSRNVYAKNKEDCEMLLKELIIKMKEEIRVEKEKIMTNI